MIFFLIINIIIISRFKEILNNINFDLFLNKFLIIILKFSRFQFIIIFNKNENKDENNKENKILEI